MKKLVLLLLAVALLTSCSQKPEEQISNVPDNIVTLNAITIGTAPEGGLDSLYAQLDQLTVPELGCRLRFTYIPWGDERNQLNIAISSGEYDIIPQGNFSDYQLMAARNAFLDIRPYLTLVPDLVAHFQSYGEDVLAITEVDGKLYGIPQYGAPAVNANEGFLFREDLRKQWGLEPVTDFSGMEAYLYRAKEDPAFAEKPLITDNRIWTSLWEIFAKDQYFEVSGPMDTPYAVSFIDDPYRVVSRMETPEFRKLLEYIAKWYRDGILDKRLLTLSANEGVSGRIMLLSGDKPCETNSPIWSIYRDWMPSLVEAHPDWEFGFLGYSMNGRVMQYKTSASAGSALTISSRSKYPETALKLLEKLHTDQRYYDLLLYGVEGEHYQRDEQGIYFDQIPSQKRFAGWSAATDSVLAYEITYRNGSAWTEQVYQPYIDRCDQLSSEAAFSPLNHFIFNVDAISAQAKNLAEAWNTYMLPLLCGLSDNLDADLSFAIGKLKEAGLDEYFDEMQRQLTAFEESKQSGR